MKRSKVLIIGGGFTGLTAAYRLSADSSLEVALWEKGADLGGLAGGFQLQGHPLEKAYHNTFMSDQSIISLVEELGLKDSVLWLPASNAIYIHGKIHPFNGPLDLLRFKPAPFLDRIRTGLVALYLKYRNDPARFESHNAGEWMERYGGKGAARTIWKPLLRGKFADLSGNVSMAWLWARLNIRARSRAKGGERFGYFRGGYQIIIDRLRQKIVAAGGTIHTGRGVAKITPLPQKGFDVTDDTGRTEHFDRVLFTASSRVFASLLARMEQPPLDYIARLKSVPYLGAICLVFASRQQLPAPYWLNVNEDGAPFLIFVNHTAFAPVDLYGGLNIYYIGTYLPATSALFQSSPETIRRLWLDYVRRIFPSFDETALVEDQLFKLNDAQHVVIPGHSSRIPDHRTPVPGLYLANFSQIYPEDRGSNFAIRDGEKLAAMIRADLAASI